MHSRLIRRFVAFPWPWRWVPVMVLTVVGIIASLGAAHVSASGATPVDIRNMWTSIWIGVAGTSAAAVLVDASAVWEAQRRLLPVKRLAGRRLGRLHQLLLNIVTVVFDDLHVDEPSRTAQALRELPEASLDLTSSAAILPPRTRQERLSELHTQLQAVREELVALASAGVLASQADEVDRLLSNSGFMCFVRDVFPSFPQMGTRAVLATQAADVVTALQALMPVAAKAAGKTWPYGQWP